MDHQQEYQWLRRFLSDPPSLQGGVSLAVEEPAMGRLVLLRLRANGSEARLRAVPLPQPYPSALRRLRAKRNDFDAVVVSHIPPGLDGAAEEMNISYLDIQGYGRVVQPGFFYFASPSWRRGAPIPQRRSPFAPKASRIVRGLLSEPRRSWKLSELASYVRLDPGNAHKILSALLEEGLVERHEDRYILEDPGTLLEAWADRSKPPREQVRLSAVDNVNSAALRLLNLIDGSAAVSGELAAELLTSYLPASSAIVYVFRAEDFEVVESWDREQIPHPVTKNLIWVRLADAGVAHFGREIEGFPLVSPAQLYVDLSSSRGRGREAAEEMRKRVLKF